MFVHGFAAFLFAGQDADAFEILQVDRRGLAPGDAGLDEKGYFAVGLAEYQFDQLLGVDLRQLLAAADHGGIEEVADDLDAAGRRGGAIRF